MLLKLARESANRVSVQTLHLPIGCTAVVGTMQSRLGLIKDWEERAAAANYKVTLLARNNDVSVSQLERFFNQNHRRPITRKSSGFHFCFRRDLAVHLKTRFRVLT